MKERREFVRLDTRIEVTYASTLTTYSNKSKTLKSRQTKTKDIGGGGLCFFADESIPPGTRLKLTAKLPNHEEPLQFKVEVIWSDTYEVHGKGSHHQATEVGAKFIEINPEDQEKIMQFVILGQKPKIS